MTILQIDRSQPFDPASFFGTGLSILEQDERALSLSEVDLTKVNLVSMLRSWEDSVEGEEKMRRLKKAGHVRLDAKVFQVLFQNQHLIPEGWTDKGSIACAGTILHDVNGRRLTLYLSWNGHRWTRHCHPLQSLFDDRCPCAVLAS
jgi:hypothetical protein